MHLANSLPCSEWGSKQCSNTNPLLSTFLLEKNKTSSFLIWVNDFSVHFMFYYVFFVLTMDVIDNTCLPLLYSFFCRLVLFISRVSLPENLALNKTINTEKLWVNRQEQKWATPNILHYMSIRCKVNTLYVCILCVRASASSSPRGTRLETTRPQHKASLPGPVATGRSNWTSSAVNSTWQAPSWYLKISGELSENMRSQASQNKLVKKIYHLVQHCQQLNQQVQHNICIRDYYKTWLIV